ncbi:hypothetical protein M405DRAFT_772092 [Rhizopogon salebrosus TDB-379]|nr:hypothetical protein M405DRAFT_772092 [Rhizopogon salebrosus TDB-379]
MNELWESFKLGFLDDVFTVFDDHTHPVVMVGDQALRWMAVDLVTYQDLDLLVRCEQHRSIVHCILATGRWVAVDHQPHLLSEAIRVAEVPRLKHVEEEFYINLWPENSFGLPVDGELREVPHVCAWNAVLVESRFYPQVDPTHHTPPWLLSDTGARFLPKTPDQTPPPLRPQRTRVYIPTIPRYIDACLGKVHASPNDPDNRHLVGDALRDVFYLIRYLHLETENQRAKLLSMLSELGEKIMRYHLDRYKRTEKWRMRPGQDLQRDGPMRGRRVVKQYRGFGSFFPQF